MARLAWKTFILLQMNDHLGDPRVSLAARENKGPSVLTLLLLQVLLFSHFLLIKPVYADAF